MNMGMMHKYKDKISYFKFLEGFEQGWKNILLSGTMEYRKNLCAEIEGKYTITECGN